MGQLGTVVQYPSVRVSAMCMRRGELPSAETEQQCGQDEPFKHNYYCLSAALSRPLRGKA